MPYVKNEGVSIFYEVEGDGFPLVLIMGLGANRTAWKPHSNEWRKHFACYKIDNRGIGLSDKPRGPYTTDAMATDVLAVMDHAGVDTAHVLGVSMGGAIAQSLYRSAPARVQSLVLVSTWAKLDNFGKAVFHHFKASRAHTTASQWIETLQLWIWGPKYMDNNLQDLLDAREMAEENPFPQPRIGFEGQCDACISHDTEGALGEVRAPTLITVGDKDIFTPIRMSETQHKGIAGSELEVFADGAHVHHWEDLERFNSRTVAFMQKHTPE
jgi:pimeloyl-ACP methyl ester carboxylesterase